MAIVHRFEPDRETAAAMHKVQFSNGTAILSTDELQIRLESVRSAMESLMRDLKNKSSSEVHDSGTTLVVDSKILFSLLKDFGETVQSHLNLLKQTDAGK